MKPSSQHISSPMMQFEMISSKHFLDFPAGMDKATPKLKPQANPARNPRTESQTSWTEGLFTIGIVMTLLLCSSVMLGVAVEGITRGFIAMTEYNLAEFK